MREEINLVQMVSDLNRGTGGRSAAANNSWRHVEMDINKLIDQHPGSSLNVEVEYGTDGRPAWFFVEMDSAEGMALVKRQIRNA